MVTASDPARVRSFFWKPADILLERSYRDYSVFKSRSGIGAGRHFRYPAPRAVN
jgi:hypothetical protein